MIIILDTVHHLDTYGGEQKCTQEFSWENLRERDHLKDPGIDERITLK
jgi:hypothetical protein